MPCWVAKLKVRVCLKVDGIDPSPYICRQQIVLIDREYWKASLYDAQPIYAAVHM